MNTKLSKQVLFGLYMMAAIFLSACGTLEIEQEPAAPTVEPTATVEESQPTSAGILNEVAADDVSEIEEVAAEEAIPAAEPPATIGYSSEQSGISFSYPTSWVMEEKANAFIFRGGTAKLRVGYRMLGETADLWGRTGMPAGDVIALEGLVSFLGQSLAKNGLFYEDNLKLVSYGGEPDAIVQSGAMEFTIVLDDPDADYQTVTITDDVISEAETILTSFAVSSPQGGPIAGLMAYTNSEYGFAFSYPSTWTVAEVNGDDFVGPGSRSVQLSQGTVTLVVGYRRSGENVPIGGSGAPGGEFEIRRTTQILGQDVERHVIVYEGQDKVVMYGQPGLPPLSAGSLEFALRMDDFAQVSYEDIELSPNVQAEADMILSSLALIE